MMRLKYILLFLLLNLSISAFGQKFDVMTYNIRLDYQPDTLNAWEKRKGKLADLIIYYRPDLLGIQEGLPHQVAFLDSTLERYAYIGEGREGGNTGEYSALYYDSTRFEVLSDSTFWLSEYPTVPEQGWDAALPRIVTYGLFRHRRSGKKLWVLNTHFDHVGEEARKNSAVQIIKHLKRINQAQLPVVVMGDLNAAPDSEPLRILLQYLDDAKNSSKRKHYGPPGTFNGFEPMAPITRRIDYILINNLRVITHLHIDDRLDNNHHISDHLLVMAGCRFE